MLDLNNMNEEEMSICDGLDALVELSHRKATEGGWWHDIETGAKLERNMGEMLMLIVTEVSEAMEAYRKNLMDDKLPHRKGIEVELGDAIIRIADLAGAHGLDLAGAILEKIEYNSNREDHKVENRRKEGGKKC